MSKEDKIIKNFKVLAVNKLREDALSILESGIGALDTKEALKRVLSKKGNVLGVGDVKYDLSSYDNVFVVGVGKASSDACYFLEKLLVFLYL